MVQPAIGVRREISVLLKISSALHVLLQLSQKQLSPNVDVERIESLHLFAFFRAHVTLAEGRHSKIDKGMAKPSPRRTGQPACMESFPCGCIGRTPLFAKPTEYARQISNPVTQDLYQHGSDFAWS